MADTYDPGDVLFTFGGQLIGGFMAGTMITIERDEDTYEKTTGADGRVVRVRKRNKGGKIICTLQSESPSNSVFSAAVLADELSNSGVSAAAVENVNSLESYSTSEAWVLKPAKREFSDGATGIEWTLDCADLDMVHAGALT